MICYGQVTKSNSGECNHRKVNCFKKVPIGKGVNYGSRYQPKESEKEYRINNPVNPNIVEFQLIHTLVLDKLVVEDT